MLKLLCKTLDHLFPRKIVDTWYKTHIARHGHLKNWFKILELSLCFWSFGFEFSNSFTYTNQKLYALVHILINELVSKWKMSTLHFSFLVVKNNQCQWHSHYHRLHPISTTVQTTTYKQKISTDFWCWCCIVSPNFKHLCY